MSKAVTIYFFNFRLFCRLCEQTSEVERKVRHALETFNGVRIYSKLEKQNIKGGTEGTGAH